MGSEVAGKARITSSNQRLFVVDADANGADDVAVRRTSGNWCREHENGSNRPLRLVEKESSSTLGSLYQVVIKDSESGTSSPSTGNSLKGATVAHRSMRQRAFG